MDSLTNEYKWFYDNQEAIEKERRELALTMDGTFEDESEFPEDVFESIQHGFTGRINYVRHKSTINGVHGFIGQDFIYYGSYEDVKRLKDFEKKYDPSRK